MIWSCLTGSVGAGLDSKSGPHRSLGARPGWHEGLCGGESWLPTLYSLHGAQWEGLWEGSL